MSGHMRKHHTEHEKDVVCVQHAGHWYHIPSDEIEKYRADDDAVDADDIFAAINKKYSKAGALLRGLRIRENLTQVELAKKINVSQSDISQMECGTRSIGRQIAQRIEKIFGVNYRSFLE